MGKLRIRPYEDLKNKGMYSVDADGPEITYTYIGKRGVRRIDGCAKASGKAVYTRDVQVPGMLYAKVMRSPYAHAKILSMDTRKAESLPGVRGILRYDDPEIKGRKLNGSVGGPDRMAGQFSGFALKPESVILAEEAWFEGQAVGAVVAADSEEIAKEALRRIEVKWAELPFILDQEEALKPEAPVLLHGAESNKLKDFRGEYIEKGDVEKGFREADKIIEFKASRKAHLWAGAEMPSVIVRWTENRLELWNHVQQPYAVKILLSEQLDIPLNQITMYTPYQGCSFGERCNPADFSINGMNTMAVIMAKKTGRPVKLLFDRAEKFYGESSDMMVGYFKVGAKKDGTITAVYMKNIFAVFWCCPGVEHFIENTRIPNLKCHVIPVDVSRAPAWWDRCEQLPNALCLTLVFDHVAAELRLDPTLVALKNDGCEGHGMNWLSKQKKDHGFPDRDSLKECIEAGKKAINWDKKWHPPGQKKLPNGKMHGIGFTWDHEWDDTRGTGSAAVWIESDGTASIVAHHPEFGVNPWTTYCQIVADELGVPVEDVTIKPFNGDQIFALMSPDGSCNLCSNGFVVRKAARKARAILLDLALNHFEGLTVEDLDIRERYVFEKANPANKKSIKDIAVLAMPMHNAVGTWTEPPIVGWAWHQHGIWGDAMETGRPRFCRQAHFMEVEVDIETGQVEVTKVVNVNDVGKAISPESVEGQMYGGTYMGVGRALTEEMVWDPQTGVLLNRNLLDYKFATISDCPAANTVIVETEMGHGPYGAVGVGEDVATVIPALLGPAVYNAIGVWVDDFPITPDKILKALGKI
jgi:xanthine dehydrogenase molybdenum-binding subunit